MKFCYKKKPQLGAFMTTKPDSSIKVLFPASGIIREAKVNNEKNPWLRFFPEWTPRWGNCDFVFDPEEKYDWLVVYDDLQSPLALNCPQAQTLLITTEPSSIKSYGTNFLSQFGYVLTGQEEWAIKHPGKIYSQPALHWFYGDTGLAGWKNMPGYDFIRNNPPTRKTQILSAVCSAKQQKHTVHNLRFKFIERLQKDIPELDRFGKGIREVIDKRETLDPFKYHITIENHIGDHWWTEKLSDAFLGLTLPFYFGAPNAAEYFPAESFIPIDIRNYKAALKTIQTAIANNEYEKRLPAIQEARRRVLEQYSLFGTIAKIIEQRHNPALSPEPNVMIQTRHSIRKNPWIALRVGFKKVHQRVLSQMNKH